MLAGNNYLSALKKLGAEIRFGGERVEPVTAHPVLSSYARTIASLYDMQMERPEAMTFRLDDGGRAGMSFIQPRNAEEVRKRGLMMKVWADFGCGFMERTPDYLNAGIAAMAAAHQFFADSDPRFGDNIQSYYRNARNHDWCATHAIANSTARADTQEENGRADTPVRLIERTGEGIIVDGQGMQATLAPFSEELLVFPSHLPEDQSGESFALSFAIPCTTKGLKFICRDDHPLSSRFDQMDCMVIFEDVLVPWERVFLCGDVARCNALLAETGAAIHMLHQVVVNNLAQSEFLLGLAMLIATDRNTPGLQQVRESLAALIAITETMRSCSRSAEAEAVAGKWGVFAPARARLDEAMNLFPTLYAKAVEIIIQPGTSSSMMTPSDHSLFRSAWQLACDLFGDRQALAERLSSVDTSKMGSALADHKDLKLIVERVRTFLARPD